MAAGMDNFVVDLLDTNIDFVVDQITLGVRQFAKWYVPDDPGGDARISWTEQGMSADAGAIPGTITILGDIASMGLSIKVGYMPLQKNTHIWTALLTSGKTAERFEVRAGFAIIAAQFRAPGKRGFRSGESQQATSMAKVSLG